MFVLFSFFDCTMVDTATCFWFKDKCLYAQFSFIEEYGGYIVFARTTHKIRRMLSSIYILIPHHFYNLGGVASRSALYSILHPCYITLLIFKDLLWGASYIIY